MRRLLLGENLNMRDLGGYNTIYKKETKFNRILRSDVPKKMNKKDLNYLKKHFFTDIIDLRSNDECLRKENALKNFLNYHNVNLKGKDCPNNENEIPITYMNIIEDHSKIYEIFKIIIASNGNVIINCSAGKDRTGVISMLLLLNAGVCEDDILADYEISDMYLRKYIKKIHQDNPDIPAFLGKSKYQYMEKTLQLFKNKYSNINNYLAKLGLTNEEINILRDKLICK